MRVHFTDIVWGDGDDEGAGLPADLTLEVPDKIITVQELTEILSYHTGFTVKTFKFSFLNPKRKRDLGTVGETHSLPGVTNKPNTGKDTGKDSNIWTHSRVSLVGGIPPVCDRCGEEDAKVYLTMYDGRVRNLGENCIVRLVTSGLMVHSLVAKQCGEGCSVDAFLECLAKPPQTVTLQLTMPVVMADDLVKQVKQSGK